MLIARTHQATVALWVNLPGVHRCGVAEFLFVQRLLDGFRANCGGVLGGGFLALHPSYELPFICRCLMGFAWMGWGLGVDLSRCTQPTVVGRMGVARDGVH